MKMSNFARNSQELECRWTSYSSYKIMLVTWMMNEVTLMFSTTTISHNGFYVHAAIHTLSLIFVGIPLVYSEICLGQYTNCNVISMWNFFPLFRSVGYGMFFLIVLKVIYIMVLTTWYLEYTFHAALDPPPWFTCEDFNDTKCMVKYVNVSTFQHCLEAQLLFDDDCGMKTSSNFFFEREIGSNNTLNSFRCVHQWKVIIANGAIGLTLFLLSLKNEKYIQVFNKILLSYVCIVIIVLFCVALSTSGTWYATKVSINWNNYNLNTCFDSLIRGFLSVSPGFGIFVYLSRDIPFRSPATMTAISLPLFSLFVTLMYALIAFSGIKTTSYYHGEEENVIEIGESSFFLMFASISEIMIYFDSLPIWSFLWFSSIFLCLIANLCVLHLFLRELLLGIPLARHYKNVSCFVLVILTSIVSWPFYCSDLTGALTDATEIFQITNSFMFSIGLYWIYGYNKHNVDIIFMIGIKASYFWKITWLLNPLALVSFLYFKWVDSEFKLYMDSYYVESFSAPLDEVIFYVLIATYILIVVSGILVQLVAYYHRGSLRDVLLPTRNWGPRDKTLFRSRNMFVPEIMTREFLYRQVRIHGYYRRRRGLKVQKGKQACVSSFENTEWSTLTSN